MRILHTADWHVGKTLRGRSRADEQRAVLDEIRGIAAEREADLILVAGDLFDTAAPSAEAEKIVYDALVALAGTGAPIVIVAGNHDNPYRLEAVGPLLKLAQVHVAHAVSRPDAGGVIRIATRSGEDATLALLPFLSQRAIVRADDLMRGEAGEHAAQYADRARRIVDALCAGLPDDTVNILVGHVMVAGGTLGGGERSAHTIEAYHVPATAFPPALHYVALGHLHRPQKIAGACPIWYSGSPLWLDFGETKDDKAVQWIEATAGRPARVETVPLTAGRRLTKLRGTLEQILAGEPTEDYLLVELDEAPRAGLADEVRQALPTAVEVRVTPRERERTVASPSSTDPLELFAAYLDQRGIEDPRLVTLFRDLLEETHAPGPA